MTPQEAYDALADLVEHHGHEIHRDALEVISALVHDGTESDAYRPQRISWGSVAMHDVTIGQPYDSSDLREPVTAEQFPIGSQWFHRPSQSVHTIRRPTSVREVWLLTCETDVATTCSDGTDCSVKVASLERMGAHNFVPSAVSGVSTGHRPWPPIASDDERQRASAERARRYAARDPYGPFKPVLPSTMTEPVAFDGDLSEAERDDS